MLLHTYVLGIFLYTYVHVYVYIRIIIMCYYVHAGMQLYLCMRVYLLILYIMYIRTYARHCCVVCTYVCVEQGYHHLCMRYCLIPEEFLLYQYLHFYTCIYMKTSILELVQCNIQDVFQFLHIYHRFFPTWSTIAQNTSAED